VLTANILSWQVPDSALGGAIGHLSGGIFTQMTYIMTLEQFLRSRATDRFSVTAYGPNASGMIQITIHPEGVDGTTLNFYVTANILRPLPGEPSFIPTYDAAADN
jgi:hypothetical protein